MADNLTPKEEFLLNPVEEHNITDAAIASFETNLKHPVKVTIPITPQQDLHGMPYPYPAGASVNLIPDGTDTENGYVNNKYLMIDDTYGSSANWYVSEYFEVDPSVTYTWSNSGASSTSTNPAICFYDENKEFISGISANGLRSQTFNPPEGAAYARSAQSKYITSTVNNKFQLEVGSIATEYRRYSNICPIEGVTGCNVKQNGKNLLEVTAASTTVQGITYTVNNDGSVTANGTATGGPANFYLQNNLLSYLKIGTYKIVGIGTTNDFIMTFTKGENNSYYYVDSKNGKAASITITENTISAKIYIHAQAGKVLNNVTIYPMVVVESEDDYSYEKYVKKPIPISWKHAEGTYNFEPIQAGEGDPSPENVRPISPALTLTRDDNSVLTVYGGSITFRDDGTSVLVSTVAIADLGELTYSKANVSSTWPYGYFVTNVPLEKLNKATDPFLMCSCYPVGDTKDPKAVISNPDGATIYFVDSDYTNSTAEEFKASLNGQTLAYKLLNSTMYVLSKAETQRAVTALGDKVSTTVYSGTVTLNEDGSADVISTHKSITFDGVKRGVVTGHLNNNFVSAGTSTITDRKLVIYKEDGSLFCNNLNAIESHNKGNWGRSYARYELMVNNRNSKTVQIILDQNASELGITTSAQCKDYINQWLKTNPVTFVYRLDSPITYHFPNVGQLKAFLGQNNIWSDIGNVNVKYLTQNSATGLEYRGDRALELRRRAMIGDAPTIHTTVGSEETSGLASFKSYIKAPVKKIEIPFGPKQDLHGYDHPWPAGGGKNLCVPYLRAPVIASGGYYYDSGYGNSTIVENDNGFTVHLVNSGAGAVPFLGYVEAGETYTISFNVTGSGYRFIVSIVNSIDFSTPISVTGLRTWTTDWLATSGNPYTFTAEYSGYVCLGLNNASSSADYTITKIQLEKGSTATAYEPYENICPISGWTGANVSGVAKNFADIFNDPSNPDKNTSWSGDGSEPFVYDTTEQAYYTTNHRAVRFNLKPGTYTISFWAKQKSTNYLYAVLGFGDNIFPATATRYSTVWTRYSRQLTLTAETQLSGVFYRTIWIQDFQIEKSNAVSDYEMYHGQTLPINWQTEAGTIYGGTIMINPDSSADVIADKEYLEYDGSEDEDWKYEVTQIGTKNFYVAVPNVTKYKNYATGVNNICNIATQTKWTRVGTNQFMVDYPYNCIDFGIAAALGLYTVPELRAYLANNPIQVALDLVAPVPYHFSNLEQLKVWLGENNFWCDISDDITVKYWNRG